MKKYVLVILSLYICQLYPQDITNKLGGNTSNETYDITDSGDNVLFSVQGDGNVIINGGELHSRNTGNAHMVPLAYGRVVSSGSIGSSGTGNWSVERSGTGIYKITFSDYPTGGVPFPQVTPYGTAPRYAVVSSYNTSGYFYVRIYDSSGALDDHAFFFQAFVP